METYQHNYFSLQSAMDLFFDLCKSFKACFRQNMVVVSRVFFIYVFWLTGTPPMKHHWLSFFFLNECNVFASKQVFETIQGN